MNPTITLQKIRDQQPCAVEVPMNCSTCRFFEPITEGNGICQFFRLATLPNWFIQKPIQRMIGTDSCEAGEQIQEEENVSNEE